MNAGKICGLGVIVVVLTPIILGFVWPTGTETIDVWDVEPAIDVTNDLNNDPIRVYGLYTGPLNNLSVYNSTDDILEYPTPKATTETPNSYPVGTVVQTTTLSVVTPNDYYAPSRVSIGGDMVYSGDGETYSYGDYWPKTNTLVLYDEDTIPSTFTPGAADTLTATGADLLVRFFGSATEYMDTTQGLRGSSTPWIWVNGFLNESVTLWVNIISSAPFEIMNNVTLTRDASGVVSASDGTDTTEIGSAYKFFQVEISSTGEIVVTGLLGVDNFLDNTYTEGNKATFQSSTLTGDPINALAMRGAYNYWWVKSAQASIGMAKGMKDASFEPEAYYGGHSWQIRTINPSTFGDSISIGSLDYAITSGSIEITDIESGETSTVQVRDMTVLSVVLEGQQEIYINGVKVLTQTPQTVTITLHGEWYASVVVSKVTQGQQDRYTWDVGHYAFDQAAFCLVGLLACVCVAIGGVIWGRVSGEKVLTLHITMILCGAAFLVMM